MTEALYVAFEYLSTLLVGILMGLALANALRKE